MILSSVSNIEIPIQYHRIAPAELIEKAQAELVSIAEWMGINQLSLNPIKTEYMIILPQSMLSQMYKALFESHIRYTGVVWGNQSSTRRIALQRLQTRVFEKKVRKMNPTHLG